MQNKENIQFSQRKPSLHMSHKPKASLRYPLAQIDSVYNSRNGSPIPTKPHQSKILHYTKSNIGRQSMATLNQNQVSVSIRQRYRVLQTNSVHQLINVAREKKQEIEDLLRKEEIKANLVEVDDNQIGGSHRKLRKVVRLMEIVCKIILGRSQHNSYIDIASHQDISLQQIQSLSVQNYQRQLSQKNNQISRLKKLVGILSMPPTQSINNQDDMILQDSPQTNKYSIQSSVKRSFIPQPKCQIKPMRQNINRESMQIDRKQVREVSVQTQDSYLQNWKKVQKKIGQCFDVQEQYSLWNILDAHKKQYDQQSKTNNVSNYEIESNQMDKIIPNQMEKIKPNQIQGNQQETIQKNGIEQNQEDKIQISSKIAQKSIQQKTYLVKQQQKESNQDKQNQPINTKLKPSLSSIQQNCQPNCQRLQFSPQKLPIIHIQPSQSIPKIFPNLSCTKLHTVHIQPKSQLPKRFKSILKIAINSLNTLNNFLIQNNHFHSEQYNEINTKMEQISEQFNKHYHSCNGYYNDSFCKSIRDRTCAIYQKLEMLCHVGNGGDLGALDY